MKNQGIFGAASRLSILRKEADSYFMAQAEHCCRVSANNHRIAFRIERSVCGYPMVEIIERPETVVLTELDNCVIIKDGFMYELKKR